METPDPLLTSSFPLSQHSISVAVGFALQISVGGRLTNRSHRIFHRGTDGPRTVIPVNIRGLVATDEDRDLPAPGWFWWSPIT